MMPINQIPNIIQEKLKLCPKKIIREPNIPIPTFPTGSRTPFPKPAPTRNPISTTRQIFQETKPIQVTLYTGGLTVTENPRPISIPTQATPASNTCNKDSDFFYQESIIIYICSNNSYSKCNKRCFRDHLER